MKTITVNKQGEIPLAEFKDYVDIDRVMYYSFNIEEEKVVLRFYDKDKNLMETRDEQQ